MASEVAISVVLYQEGQAWIAQGLEYDITAQGHSLPDVQKRFAMKVGAEIIMALELGESPFDMTAPAPQKFWQMYQESRTEVSAQDLPIRILKDGHAPRVSPRMKVGELAAA